MKNHQSLPQIMTIAEAEAVAGTLSKPSKLSGYSIALDARTCRAGSRLRNVPGSTCSECYALNDFYTFRWVQAAMARRHAGLQHPRWVDAMVVLIRHYCRPDNRGGRFFRWHDSGDLQSVDHLRRIVEVCRRTPDVEHWLPTREYRDVAEFLAGGGDFPDNLAVRLSATMIDSRPVLPLSIAHLLKNLPTSTVQTNPCGVGKELVDPEEGAVECRASKRKNKCGPCRACWSQDVGNVSYAKH